MLIREEALRHWLENFYGYGSWDAKFWFVALEEGSGDQPQEVADKFNYFERQHSNEEARLCDIRKLYSHLSFEIGGPRAGKISNLFEYRFGEHAVLHGGWKNLIAFVHGFSGKSLPKGDDRAVSLLDYQKNQLAQPSQKKEALLRLYPLPAHNHAWYYSWLDLPHLKFLRTRATYREYVFDRRIHHILENIRSFKPNVVVMYGMENVNELKKAVQTSFSGARFRMVKAIGREIPQHHITELGVTKLLITTQIPALRHNRIETGFDWEAFGKSQRS